MEDSQPLSIESFSYTWLVNRNPSLDSPNRSFRLSFDAMSFIEMDPNLTPSKRFLVHQDFDFKMANFQTPMTLVDADKLISNGNGILVPHSLPVSPSYHELAVVHCKKTIGKSRSGKCNKLPKMIILKYMDLVRPLWSRMTKRGSRVRGVENWECSSASDNILRRSCDSESSIHEAVVHCKKTIGMN